MYEQERPFDHATSSHGDPMWGVDVEYDECGHCHAEVPVTDGESVVVHTHRIEGQGVGTDTEFMCRECIEAAEDDWP